MRDKDDDIQEYAKPWVGLTKAEVELLSYLAEGNTWIAVELAEAKLKEKNS
jgi:DNA-binding CsgD family transcriptional regulator